MLDEISVVQVIKRKFGSSGGEVKIGSPERALLQSKLSRTTA